MEVELYVYDLSNGLARTMSAALLGTHIDAVYHTSIVFKGIEYGEIIESGHLTVAMVTNVVI
jgi:hypothetical protein